MLFSGSFLMLMSWTDIIMLGIYETEESVAIYSVALRIAGLTSLTLVAVNTIAAPKFIEFYFQKNILGLEKIVKQSSKLIFLTSFPLLIVYFLFPKFIMGLFGSEFILGSSVLIIISIGQFINAASGSVGSIMQMTDNQKKFQNIIIISAIINIEEGKGKCI